MFAAKKKWAGALAALLLVVGIGNAVAGTNPSSDELSHTLVSTGAPAPHSLAEAVASSVAQELADDTIASEEIAENGVKAREEAEQRAKAEEEKAKAEAEAEAQRTTEAQTTQRSTSAAAPTSTPQTTQENAATNANGTSNGGDSSSAAPAPSSSGGGDTVYLTNTGECYHANGCRHLNKSKISTTRDSAIAQGYRPCGTCKP